MMNGHSGTLAIALILIVVAGYAVVSSKNSQPVSDELGEPEYYQAPTAPARQAAQSSVLSEPAVLRRESVKASPDKRLTVSKTKSSIAAPGTNADQGVPSPLTFENSDYTGYDESTLAQLIEGGDVVAMQVQAIRYLTKDRSPENVKRAHELLNKAIIYGAKHYPFQFLAEHSSFDLLLSINNSGRMSDAGQRSALVDTFVYYELAAMRGNPDLKDSMVKLYSEQFQLQPTNTEWGQIRQKADRLYKEYERKRIDSGLGAFDS